MNPIDRIIVDAAFAALLRNRARLLVPVCSGRIHDAGASTVADINAMFTEAENDGSLQHTPIIRGGQGRSDAEVSELGETLHAGCKWFIIVIALATLAMIAAGVV